MSLAINLIKRTRTRCAVIPRLCPRYRVSIPSRSPKVHSRASSHLSTAQGDSVLDADGSQQSSTNVAEPRIRWDDTTHTTSHWAEKPLKPSWAEIPAANRPSRSRHARIRNAYKIDAIQADPKERAFYHPVTGLPRDYPTGYGRMESEESYIKDMKRQIGHDVVHGQVERRTPTFQQIFKLLLRTTPKTSERSQMSAIRIVLPSSWTVEVQNFNIEYVDSVTGVLQKLRASPDIGSSSIILRGRSSTLSKAADEIVRHCPEAMVYKLGNVEATDYETRQLWPAIENNPGDGTSPAKDDENSIWIHKHYEPFDIKQPYDDIPKPTEWTKQNFEEYIATLCFGRIPADLVITIYGERLRNGRYIDTDGIRLNLLHQALYDPGAQQFITAPILKMVISLAAFKGGHQAKANELYMLGEKVGVPMDTDTYNIMLDGYVNKRDPLFFYSFLRQMTAKCLEPNAKTWLLFLELFRGEDERKKMLVAMYDMGMLRNATTRREVARILAPVDAYWAFKSGVKLNQFLLDQEDRYGRNWLSDGAIDAIIIELSRFEEPDQPRGRGLRRVEEFVEYVQKTGYPIKLKTVNVLFQCAIPARSWVFANWVMTLFKGADFEPDPDTYHKLINLAIVTQAPYSLGLVFFYGVLHRKLKHATRRNLAKVFAGDMAMEFWKSPEHQPYAFPPAVIGDLKANKHESWRSIVSRIERAILDRYEGYLPIKSLRYRLPLTQRRCDNNLQRLLNMRSEGKDIGTGYLTPDHISIQLHKIVGGGAWSRIWVRLDGRFDKKTMVDIRARLRPPRGAFDDPVEPPAPNQTIPSGPRLSKEEHRELQYEQLFAAPKEKSAKQPQDQNPS